MLVACAHRMGDGRHLFRFEIILRILLGFFVLFLQMKVGTHESDTMTTCARQVPCIKPTNRYICPLGRTLYRMDEAKRPGYDTAIVFMGTRKIDMSLILPVHVSDDDVMRSKVPIFSTYRMKVLDKGRVTIPKAIRDSLGIKAGHDVDIIVIPVKEGDQK